MSSTSPRFKHGDMDARGYYFRSYKYGKPTWYSPEAWKRSCVYRCYTNAKIRAVKKNIPFEITTDYLISIWPKNDICPVFKVKMEQAKGMGGRPTSPSLDRIDPDKGYVPGNVLWVSYKANIIKNKFEPDDIITVGKFYKSLKLRMN